MPLILDVLTKIDERAAAADARELERTFTAAGEVAGVGFGAEMAKGIRSGIQRADFESILGVLSTAGMVGKAAEHGKLIGAAFVGGITLAAGFALVDLGVKIGETFEDINRQVTLHTAATGQALEGMKTQVDALVGSLDTSTKNIGTDFALLQNRLGLTGTELGKVTRNVEVLRDRFGDFNIQALTGALLNMGVGAGQVNDTIASLAMTSKDTGISMSDLATNLAASSDVFKDLHLNAEQSAAMLGLIEEKGIPATKAISGLEMGMKAAHKVGLDFNTFMHDMVFTLGQVDEKTAEQLELAVGGPRRWAELQTSFAALGQVQAAGPGGFAAPPNFLPDLEKQTETLANKWQLVKNAIASALAPPGLSVTDEVSAKMDTLIAFIDAHADDLRKLFEGSLDAIESVVEGLGKIAAFLGHHPALIEAVAYAFATWESIKGVNKLLTAGEGILAWLRATPAAAATAGTSIATAGAEAEAGWAWALGTGLGALLGIGTLVGGTAIAGGAAANAATGKEHPFWWAPEQYALLRGLDLPKFGPFGGPVVEQGGGLFGTGGGGGAAPAPAGAAPSVIGAAGGEQPSWFSSPWFGPAPAGAAGGPGGELITPDMLEPGGKGKGRKGPRLPTAPQVPYPAGYGEPPRPGETEEQYSREQRILEQRHNIEEARARLNQLEHDNNATAEDIQKAKNDLLHAQSEEYRAELEQTKKHLSGMEELGAKIDQDFGISKGLPGIAENLTKFLANLAFAPVFGALGGAQAAAGFPGGQGLGGAKGLIGMAGLSGMFGPQFTVAGGGGGGAGMDSYTTPTLPSISSPKDLMGASAGVANLFRVAQAMVGTPYSTQLRNDCSGMVSKLATAALGMPPSVQFDTTGEGAWLLSHGFKSGMGGPSDLSIGWNPLPGMAGHTAATLPGGIPAEQGGSTPGDRFTLGPGAAGASSPQFSQHAYLPMGAAPAPAGQQRPGIPGYAAGGNVPDFNIPNIAPMAPSPSGGVPIMAHPGEHVLTTQDVAAMGGQQGVYDFRAALQGGPQPASVGRGASQIGGLGAPVGLGSGFTVTGGGLIGIAESVPATAVEMAIAAGMAAHLYGGEVLPNYQVGGAVEQAAAGGPGAGPGAGALGGASGALGAGLGQAPAGQMGGPTGGSGTGAGGGGAPGGSVISAAIGIGIQEINEAISKGGQAAGALVGGLQQTFGLQQFAGSKLAQTGWVSRIIGGIAGAQPQLPNIAGQHEGASPAGVPGMTPMQDMGGLGAGLGLAGAPTPDTAAGPPSGTAVLAPPTPDSVAQGAIGGAGAGRGALQPSDQGGGIGGAGGAAGPSVYIEQFHAHDDPNSAGQEIARHVEAGHSGAQNSLTGGR